MFRRQLVIRPDDGTLKQAPHALYAVSVNVSAYPFLCRIIDCFMAGIGVCYSPVVPILIRVNRLARRVCCSEPLIASRGFKFNKRAELFVGVHNKALSVAAMRVCNPDRSPAGING